MPQEIFAQLEKVCQRRRRRCWLAATCWALTTLIVVTFGLASLDYLLGINGWVGRLLLTTLFASCLGGIYACWHGAVLNCQVAPLQIAHEVEGHHPELSDVVSSAWDFYQQEGNDPTAGSESLRRAVVLRADASASEVDWNHFVPRKQLRRAGVVLAGTVFLASLFGWWQPERTSFGLARLTSPSWDIEWPREHDLQFVNPPTLLATGEDLVLQLRDTRGTLPKSITIHYRTGTRGSWNEESHPMAATTPPLEIRRPNVQESLQYRATGADHHTMPWQSLEVVAPPRIEQLQITVHPPAYTLLPTRTWEKGAAIYAGSELTLQGRTDQSVTKVVLQGENGKSIDCQVAPDGRAFRNEPSAWQAESSDTITLQMTTTAGLTARAVSTFVLEVITDHPPQVRFLEPIDDLAVLPTGVVPLVIEASDELAVTDIELAYRRSDQPDDGEQRLLIWTSSNNESVRQQRVEFLWELAPLSFEPGSYVELHAHANDRQPATGQTLRALRLKIVSEDQLWHEILERQTRLVERLIQLQREQRELRSRTHAWSEVPEWSKSRWASASHAALFQQRQIVDLLAGNQHSIVEQLANITQTIERNRLLRPEAVDRILTAQELLQNLADVPLTVVMQSLREFARQSSRSSEQKAIRPRIATLGEKQDQVLAGLHEAIDLLMPGNVLGRMERELASIATEQENLLGHCKRVITPQMLQQNNDHPDLQLALASATRRQRELARRLAQLMLDMTHSARRLAERDSLLATRLSRTVAFAEELGTQINLQAAADQLARRRLGRSMTLQQHVLEDLVKLRARLTGRDAKEAVKRLQQLQAIEKDLQRLRRQVATLERELHQQSPSQLGKVAKTSDEIAKQLEQLQVPSAAKATRNAASQLRRTSPNNNVIKQARQQLGDAQRELTNARRRQQVALARLEMARLDAKLDLLIARQRTIQQDILRRRNNKAQKQNASQLIAPQSRLRQEVFAEADQLTSLPVFAHLLTMAGETMQSIENLLQKSEIGQSTSDLSEQAIRQLTQLSEVLRKEQKNLAGNSGSRSGAGQGRKKGDKPQEQTLQLALGQLQLLKSLQSALHKKTQTHEEQRVAGQPITLLPGELTRQQKELTKIASQLISESSEQESEP